MSSTLAFPLAVAGGTPERQSHHQLFSATNLSSISLLVNVSGRSAGGGPPTPLAGGCGELFRTPKRRDEAAELMLLRRRELIAGSTPSSGSYSPGSGKGIYSNTYDITV